MNLLISGELTAPPSEVGAFRTLTMYATIFKNMDCLVEVSECEIDYYYNWLKNRYAMDYVQQLIYVGEECGVKLTFNNVERLTFNNLNDFISMIDIYG